MAELNLLSETELMMSAFIKHRDKVLGHYSTAAWLRSAVMAMWNGSSYQVGLSSLATLDDAHYTAFREMVENYRAKGENDPSFMALAEEVRVRQAEEQAAVARQAELDDWCGQVRYELRIAGLKGSLIDDHFAWFEDQFTAGQTPSDAAKAFAAKQVAHET